MRTIPRTLFMIVVGLVVTPMVATVLYAQAHSPLHELDVLAASLPQEHISSSHLLNSVLQNAHNAEIRSLNVDNTVDTGFKIDSPGGSSPVFSDGDLARTFNEWIVQIGGSSDLLINPQEIRFYRNFLANFSPHFFPLTNQGQVGALVSSAQFAYLFDSFIANGGVPYVTRTTATDTPSTLEATAAALTTKAAQRRTYDEALAAYIEKTTPAQRTANMRGLLNVLPFSVSNPR